MLVFRWQHSFNGIATESSTRDFRCQNCGVKFSVPPRVTSITFIVLGLVMSCAVFPIAFAWIGWRQLRRDRLNPVVPDAPLPPLRYREGPPARQCVACQSVATLTRIVRKTHNGIPTGTDYQFECGGCRKTFEISSLWGHLFALFALAVVMGCGALFFSIAESPGWKYGGSGALWVASLLVLATEAQKVSNRFRYPASPGPASLVDRT